MPTCRCKNPPAFENRHKNPPIICLVNYRGPTEVWFMINFASCFMIDKGHWWGTFPKCEARLSYCHILGHLFCECPHPEALPYAKGLVTLGGVFSFLPQLCEKGTSYWDHIIFHNFSLLYVHIHNREVSTMSMISWQHTSAVTIVLQRSIPFPQFFINVNVHFLDGSLCFSIFFIIVAIKFDSSSISRSPPQ
jgi:hypothetical protein